MKVIGIRGERATCFGIGGVRIARSCWLAAAVVFASAAMAGTGGIETGTGYGDTKASACQKAIDEAKQALHAKDQWSQVTNVSCDCNKDDKDSGPGSNPWSCIGMVAWRSIPHPGAG